ncbi:type VI secretion system-associated FHA domain protein TagH [Corallincola platygyrae]|uniref:Type VI secretion system-associated FHA domain protein TagH n=1 Tax=Corallincola platygyrae TaxID=1193278 RepID=A0ABW4XMC5_9GAMM
MELTLSVVSYHRFTAGQETSKQLSLITAQSDLVIGRADECDWHLPDPERVLSGRHAVVSSFKEGFVVTDISTNGLFINRDIEALGRNNSHTLVDGDLLTLGDYEIEVKLTSDAVKVAEKDPQSKVSQASAKEFGFHTTDFEENLASKPAITPKPSSAIGPSAAAETLEVLGTDAIQLPATKPLDEIKPTEAADWEKLIIGEVPATKDSAESNKPAHSSDTHSQNQGHQANHFSAFLNGAQITPNMVPKDPEDAEYWCRQLGEVFNLLLVGLMKTMHGRSLFKQQVRANQTLFGFSENNPLKFSATYEDAIHNLVGRQSSGYLSHEQAIKQSFKDIEQHETALFESINGAMLGLMQHLDPNGISGRFGNSAWAEKMLPSHAAAKHWRAYLSEYQNLKQQLQQEGASVFMDDFVKAYESSIAQQEAKDAS